MTESEAYERAAEYIRKKGFTHYGCKYRASAFSVDSRGLQDCDFPKDLRRKVWFFTFASRPPPPPNVIVCGGDYVVCVDDDTGLCGYFPSL